MLNDQTITVTTQPNTEAIEIAVSNYMTEANAFAVVDTASFQEANARRAAAKSLKKQIEDTFDPILKTQRAALDETRAQRDKHLVPVSNAETTYKTKMGVWQRAEEKRIADEQEVERKRQQRRSDEARLAAAVQAAQEGDATKATAILETPYVVPPPPPPPMPKARGFYPRKGWTFVIENAALLPREYLVPDEVKIGGVVRAMKGYTRIPGVRAFEVDIDVSR